MSAPVILVIEDGVETQISLRRDFSALGCEVVIAGSAEEGLEKLAGGVKPNVIVLDFILPGMSGPEFYRHLRDDPDKPVPPVIPFTSTLQDSLPGSQTIISEFMGARVGAQPMDHTHPIVAKGGDEVSKVPISLLLAVAHCLQRQKVPLPASYKQLLRNALNDIIEG